MLNKYDALASVAIAAGHQWTLRVVTASTIDPWLGRGQFRRQFLAARLNSAESAAAGTQ
jgi:hypothetical protein